MVAPYTHHEGDSNLTDLLRSSPTIGIAMAAYQAADTIGATLRAILAQSRPPARAVVVIDGADPDTEEVVRAFAPEIEYLVLPHNTGGPGGPRNAAVTHLRASGDVDAYCFFDADDIPYPRFLEVATDLMVRHPECPIIYTGFDFWHPPEDLPTPEAAVEGVHPWTLEDYLERSGEELLGFALVRSEACRTVRASGLPFDPELRRNQDYDLTVRLLADASAVATDWRGAAYRILSTSHSASGVDAWLSRLLATESLGRHFRGSDRRELVAMMDRSAGSALRRAARHLWIRGNAGDRRVALRLLLDDVVKRRDPRSMAVLLTLGLGVDVKAARMSVGDHRRIGSVKLG